MKVGSHLYFVIMEDCDRNSDLSLNEGLKEGRWGSQGAGVRGLTEGSWPRSLSGELHHHSGSSGKTTDKVINSRHSTAASRRQAAHDPPVTL